MHCWLLVALAASLPFVAQAPPSSSSSTEIVRIEGAKNPELVPEYAIWLQVLRWLRQGPGVLGGSALPDGLREHVAPEEEALIFKEAERLETVQADCVQRAIKAREPLAKLEAARTPIKDRLSTAREVDARIWEIELSCRWETLHARDRLLERLGPEARAALLRHVDLKKGGMNFLVPRNGLERFRQPQ